MGNKFNYNALTEYIGFNKLPEGFERLYEEYEPEEDGRLMSRKLFDELLAPYSLSEDKYSYLVETLDAIEKDEKVLHFSRFFVWDMCSERNRCDIDVYTELVPKCLGKYNDAYAFIIMLACVETAVKDVKRRGIPEEYYSDVPHRMLREQMERYIKTGRIDVEDMPWKLNFYTLAIFLFDRFLFIPYWFDDGFRLYRRKRCGAGDALCGVQTADVVGIYDAGYVFDREGQLLRDEEAIPDGGFITSVDEDDEKIVGYRMNPIGYTEDKKIALSKDEYELSLDGNTWLLGFHIPSGEGYTPERVRNSMKLALDFYDKYYPEMNIRGFWSESWLYDPKLTLLLSPDKNIIQVQRQFFCYSCGEDGEMLYIHLFNSMETKLEEFECRTSLQEKAKQFLLKGNCFHTTGMVVLREDVENIKSRVNKTLEKDLSIELGTEVIGLYATESDFAAFRSKMESILTDSR